MGAQFGKLWEDLNTPEVKEGAANVLNKLRRVVRTAYWIGGQTCWILSTGMIVLIAPALAEFDRECAHFELTAALQAAQIQQQQQGMAGAPM
ncbi:unnamed protein product [Amoebophrya sp. A120]|nr:unnamed protein product [Amoebophrya sp. A120]|eukprot:GSA120T00011421001.1